MSRLQELVSTRSRVFALAVALGVLVFGIFSVGTPAAHSAARLAAAPQPPRIKLIAAQDKIEVARFGKEVFVDPGIWVASLGGAFQLNVARASYTRPLTVTQVIKNLQGVTTQRRVLPPQILARWTGLRHFLKITIRNSKGKVVASNSLTFCPAGFELSRATADSALTSRYPNQCSASDPFSLGEVWGLARGWAADPVDFRGYKLGLGTYKLSESIEPTYQHLFGIAARDATASVTMKVINASQCCSPEGCCDAARVAPVPEHFVAATTSHAAGAAHPALRSLPAVPTLSKPPADTLPDLIPLPSWGISVTNQKSGTGYLDFGATVWIAGHAKLDVEGFRNNGSDLMRAYQYFWQNGHLIGRAPVGTMGFSEYNSWHFQQFAQYRLLNAHKKTVVVSQKIGFCIAPTDGVDMLLRGATWQPQYTGIVGNCGQQTALWVQELLPLGWGDTYEQQVPHQSFDITQLPDGTYYIEIIANPEHLLHEVSSANDISLRKVIISGKPGHRTVRVPAWHGLDAEH